MLREVKEEAFLNPCTRPDWVNKIITLSFNQACDEVKEQGPARGYIYRGTDTYVYLTPRAIITSDQIVDALDGDLSICDIGAGDNSLLRTLQKRGKVTKGMGITAAAYGTYATSRAKFDDYIIANAENLSSIEALKPNSFDIVFSRMTLRHMQDFFGTLVQAYNLLKEGGVLVIDEAKAKGFGEWLRHLVGYLREEGYQIATVTSCYILDNSREECFETFCIAKINPTLDLPIKYSPITDRDIRGELKEFVGYVPTSALVEYRRRKYAEVKSIDMSKIDARLKACFNTPGYSSLPVHEQASRIKKIVSEMSPEQQDNATNILKAKSLLAWKRYSWILGTTINRTDKLAIYAQDESWDADPDIALAQIKALAALELRSEAEAKQMETFFQTVCRMPLSYAATMSDTASTVFVSILPAALVDRRFPKYDDLYERKHVCEDSSPKTGNFYSIYESENQSSTKIETAYASVDNIKKYLKNSHTFFIDKINLADNKDTIFSPPFMLEPKPCQFFSRKKEVTHTIKPSIQESKPSIFQEIEDCYTLFVKDIGVFPLTASLCYETLRVSK